MKPCIPMILIPLLSLICWQSATGDPLAPFLKDKFAASGPLVGASGGRVTAGLIVNDRNSAKLGEYTGLRKDDVYGLAAFFTESKLTDSNISYRVQGKDLGLDSRQILGHLGFTGGVRVNFSYRELPHYRYDDAASPFQQLASNRWVLPDNWIGADTVFGLTALKASLRTQDTGTKRERLDLNMLWPLNRHWSLAADYRRENKEGSRLTGLVFGVGGTQMAVVVPGEIDRHSDNLGLTLTYSGWLGSFSGGFRFSDMDERSDPLVAQNPYSRAAFADTANYPGGFGRIAPPPDNRSRTLFAKTVLRLGRSSRLSLDLQRARHTQDDSFLPYTVNSGLEAPLSLPATSLDGEMIVTGAGLALSLRPTTRTDMTLRYRYRDRDNRTDRLLFAPVLNDVIDQGDDPAAGDILVNRPLGSTSRKLELDGGYRLQGGWKLSAGLEQEKIQRQFLPVSETEERGGHLKLGYQKGGTLSGWLKWRRTDRDSDDYIHNAAYLAGFPQSFIDANGAGVFVNDPAMRQFFIADRQRDQQDLLATWAVRPDTSVSLKLGRNLDRYDDTYSGLSRMRGSNACLDLGYSPLPDLGLFGYLSRAWQEGRQAGYQWLGFQPQSTLPPLRDNSLIGWQVDTESRSTTVGSGLHWKANERLELDVEYVWTESETGYDFEAGSSLLAAPLPDLTLLWRDLNARLRYRWRDDIVLGVQYRYRNYSTQDFALDGVAVDTDASVLFAGVQSPNFRGNSLALSVTYDFH